MKDWTGNRNSVFKCLGASNHTDNEREENDYYASEPKTVEVLLEQEKFYHTIWECACGEGHMSKVLVNHGYSVVSTDLIYRGYGTEQSVDFLSTINKNYNVDIITNPPYRYAKEFVEKALQVIRESNKVAMLLKLTFLEGKSRKKLFQKYPPKTVYVFSGRVKCAKNGDFDSIGGSATAYAWFVWEKGFKGDPVIKWVN